MNFSVYRHRGRKFVAVYRRHGTKTHVGSVFLWRFSAGNGRCGFVGGMPLVHLVLGLLLRGIGAFYRCYSQHLHLRVIICVDWAGRLSLAALDGGHGVAMIVLSHGWIVLTPLVLMTI